jgi:hypothetical protein
LGDLEMIIDINNVKNTIFKDVQTCDLQKYYCDLDMIKLPFDEFIMKCESQLDHEDKGKIIKLKAEFRSIFKKSSESEFILTTNIVFENQTHPMFVYKFNTKNGKLQFELNKDGHIKIQADCLFRCDTENRELKMLEADAVHVYFSLFSIQLMNCKNVHTEEVDPNQSLSRQVKRHMARKNMPPLEKYHVITIDHMKKSNKKEFNGASVNVINHKPLHICRGHFRTYQGKGLFGKYKGTFWIPAHAKGTKENGVINKEYKIGKVKCDSND